MGLEPTTFSLGRDVLEAVVTLAGELEPGDRPTSATIYDRLRGRHAFQKSETVTDALRFLEERRYVRLIRRDGPGPMSYLIVLNPLYQPAKMRRSPELDHPAQHNGVISQFRTAYG